MSVVTGFSETFFAPEQESRPFWCAKCEKWWVTFRWNVSCCVYHPDGHCHYNDRETPAPEGTTPLTDIDFESFS